MRNGNLSQFLDTGWYMESVLFFQGYVYWCEAVTSFETNTTTFFVDRWKAECDGELYHQYVTASGKLIDYERVLEISGTDMDDLKRRFLTENIFDGKSFWEVENNLVWVEEGTDISIP